MKMFDCPNCGREVKVLARDMMGKNQDYDIAVCPSNDCKYYKLEKIEKQTWYFTVEKDIPIMATSEEEAEQIFESKHGNAYSVLGIVRPFDTTMRKCE